MLTHRERLARTTYWSLLYLDCLLGTRKSRPFRKIRTKVQAHLARPSGIPTRIEPVPERKADYLDAELLRQLELGGPVLFKGLARKIPAVDAWTLEALIERFGDVKADFRRSSPEYSKKDNISFGEVLRAIGADRPTHFIQGNRESDFLLANGRMREELAATDWVDQKFIDEATYRKTPFVIAGRGHWTPIHAEMGHILSAQIRGTRRWTMYDQLVSPHFLAELDDTMVSHLYENAAGLREESFGLTGWECVLEPGDVLFCPIYYWHFVETLEASISVSIKWAALRSVLKDPVTSAFFLTAWGKNSAASRLWV